MVVFRAAVRQEPTLELGQAEEAELVAVGDLD
jgi:hypothetical protein